MASGFITIFCASLGGEASLATAHIAYITPTLRHNNAIECTIVMDTGDSLRTYTARDDIIELITEATAGSAQIDQITAQVQANTDALAAAIKRNLIPPG